MLFRKADYERSTMNKRNLMATIARLPDASPGGMIATAMRHLASAAPSATGCTLISPDGTVRHISRAEAEAYMRDRKARQVVQ
jgi:hypothetical protein